jgi:hypothetical protein
MAGIGTRKKTRATTKPKQEILRIRDLKLSTNPQSLLELLKRYDINPVDILIKMDEKRRVTAFITVHENLVLPLNDLLDRNINAWVVNEEEHGKLRWPRSTGWQAIGPMI